MSRLGPVSGEPSWLVTARSYVGLKEIPGVQHEPTIVKWLTNLKAWWKDDEVPWCGTYVAQCFSENEILLPKHWYRAKDWLNWGIKLPSPTVGCVVVYERTGGGHVGFVVGQDSRGYLMTLGGNQGNKVSIAPFDRSRVLGYRWPDGEVIAMAPLPLLDSDGKPSVNEA
jgi:uncharacterized protein (TIGR02594 family)